jgi:hypothetical protein
MQQASGHSEKEERLIAGRAARHGQSHSHEDDADIFDAVIGQKTLQVMLTQGEDDSQQAADAAQNQQTQPQRGGRGRRVIILSMP